MESAARPPGTIAITGDLLIDQNLRRDARTPEGHHEPVPEAMLKPEYGGAWYLESMLRLACEDLAGSLEVRAPERQPVATEAYSVWSLHPRHREAAKDDRVWRVSEFLGCTRTEGRPQFLPVANDIPDPGILAIDDLALGFRENPAAWPLALREGGNPRMILLKTCAPLGTGLLWERLKDFADRLIVVVDVGSLRERRAAIARALSWDLAIEQTVKAIQDGALTRDLGHCGRLVVHFGRAGAAVFSRSAPGYERRGDLSTAVRFERFLYDPRNLEGSLEANHPGTTFGTTSILCAAMARHTLDPGSFPLFLALGRALDAVRYRHEIGGGSAGFDPNAANPGMRSILHPTDPEPADRYATAFPRHFLDGNARGAGEGEFTSDLLQDLTGPGLDYAAVTAAEVVIHGPAKALRAAPSAQYGDYFTVDRQEIERINGIRNLFLSYAGNRSEKSPLSIAVFGPPGSGKSFAIKELGSQVLGPKTPFLEFNISQLTRPAGLHQAFHQVRDQALAGQVPIVFWDEFDSDALDWLKEFIGPMQDGKFVSEGIKHPLGHAIFVFAGGTAPTFELFDQTRIGGDLERRFREKKGPDFVSRLRGYVNIKGPNPVPRLAPGQPYQEPASQEHWERAAREDPAHLIRRALILRSALERAWPHLIGDRKVAAISRSVVRGFLRVQRFIHGARSLEALVRMSDLRNVRFFAAGQLPPAHLLALHASPDFLEQAERGDLEAEEVEALAADLHQAWMDDLPPERRERDPLCVPFARLPEDKKELSRAPARLARPKLQANGYTVERRDTPRGAGEIRVAEPDRERLLEWMAVSEHDRWIREKLLQGWDWFECTRKELRLHCDILPFERVPLDHQGYDRGQAAQMLKTLERLGYELVRKTL